MCQQTTVGGPDGVRMMIESGNVEYEWKNGMRRFKKCREAEVRIPMASLDVSHNQKRVEENRLRAVVEALFITIKRKRLTRVKLVEGAIARLSTGPTRFKPHAKTIEKGIKHLIEKEWMEHDPDDPTGYRYLA